MPDSELSFDAILFYSDGRQPSIVSLMTSPMSVEYQRGSYQTSPSRMPHPEVHMDYIAEGLGPRSWKYQLIEALDGMTKKFASPYIVFYPTISRDGMLFPINKTVKQIQGRMFREDLAWRGNILIGKYKESNPFASFTDASMADFPIVKNWLMTHGCPPH